MINKKLLRCYICGDPRALEQHHIKPQAYGGQDGPTVTICSNCHGLVHKMALRLLSKSGSKEPLFPTDQWGRAKPIVMSVVITTQEGRDNPNLDHPTTLMLKVPKRMRSLLHLMKTDAGFSNLEDFCIAILKNYMRGKL